MRPQYECTPFHPALRWRLALGMVNTCSSKDHLVGWFEYHASFKDVGSEHELCSVYVGRSVNVPHANRNEVAKLSYIAPDDLDKALADDDAHERDDLYSPWLKLEWARIRKDFWSVIEEL